MAVLLSVITGGGGRTQPEGCQPVLVGRRGEKIPPRPFDLVGALNVLRKLDSGHYCSILHHLGSLDHWTASSVHLCLLLRALTQPCLHDLKALQILSFSQCFRDWHAVEDKDVRELERELRELDEPVDDESELAIAVGAGKNETQAWKEATYAECV